jgi:hypothetical protein
MLLRQAVATVREVPKLLARRARTALASRRTRGPKRSALRVRPDVRPTCWLQFRGGRGPRDRAGTRASPRRSAPGRQGPGLRQLTFASAPGSGARRAKPPRGFPRWPHGTGTRSRRTFCPDGAPAARLSARTRSDGGGTDQARRRDHGRAGDRPAERPALRQASADRPCQATGCHPAPHRPDGPSAHEKTPPPACGQWRGCWAVSGWRQRRGRQANSRCARRDRRRRRAQNRACWAYWPRRMVAVSDMGVYSRVVSAKGNAPDGTGTARGWKCGTGRLRRRPAVRSGLASGRWQPPQATGRPWP